MTNEAQNRKIFEYMKMGETITSYEALGLFGCMRLSARIKDLRDSGVQVMDAWEYKLDENGKVTKKWKKYWIAAAQDQSASS